MKLEITERFLIVFTIVTLFLLSFKYSLNYIIKQKEIDVIKSQAIQALKQNKKRVKK